MKNSKINLPDSVKELSEMYALRCISLTQVAEEVEKFPLNEQALMMSRAMIHAELYYREYEEWANSMEKTLSPADEEYLAKQLTGELPIKNGNKLSVVNDLYLMDYNLSEHFKTLYPKAWEIFCYYRNMI